MKGKFISFEGPEGSGKTTQSLLLCKYLTRRGYKTVHTREPGGTSIGEQVREILLDPINREISVTCEILLYMAARAQLVKEVIWPALKSGKIVICDRFLDATICYQGYGGGADIAKIKKMGDFVTEGIMPDLTIFLDIETQKGLRRSRGPKDRIERKSIAYHQKVRRGYLTLAKADPERIKVISARKSIDEIQKLVREAMMEILK